MKIEKMEKMEREGSRALGGRLEWEFLRSFFFFSPAGPPRLFLSNPRVEVSRPWKRKGCQSLAIVIVDHAIAQTGVCDLEGSVQARSG